MATATAQSQVANIRSERKAAALDVYVENVNRTAADKPMGTDDAEALEDAMERLDFTPELFTSDVEAKLSLKYQTIPQFDYAKDDADREAFHAFLKARADRRERERLHPVAPRHKAIPLTRESCEKIQHDNEKRIAICNQIIAMLKDECTIVARNGGLKPIGPVANQLADLQYRIDEAINMAATLRDFEYANPRLFRGTIEDRRPAWTWETVCEKRTEQRRGGSRVELAARTEFEVRLAWRPDGETVPPANPNNDFHRMVLEKPVSNPSPAPNWHLLKR